MSLPRAVAEWLIFGERGVRRFTQDSPVLPDVWLRFAEKPDEALELILTPYRETKSGEVAVTLRARLEKDQGERQEVRRISYIQGNVAVKLTFDEVVRIVLPMTDWWDNRVYPGWTGWEQKKGEAAREVWEIPESERQQMMDGLVRELCGLGDEDRKARQGKPYYPLQKHGAPEARSSKNFLWMLRLVGAIALSRQQEVPATPEGWAPDKEDQDEESGKRLNRQLVVATFGLIAGFNPWAKPLIFQINRNRPAQFAIRDSRLAVKADAAAQVFSISCKRLTWVVIDGGIDATHPAFRKRRENGEPYEQAFEEERDAKTGRLKGHLNRTRIEATYDFSGIRDLINPTGLQEEELPEHLQKLVGSWSRKAPERKLIADLKKRLQAGQEVDWSLLEPLLRVPHNPEHYWVFPNDHGTHVAGILASDWQRGPKPDPGVDLTGLCPDMNLYDIRVLPHGAGSEDDEFNVIAALQFVRYLNSQKRTRVIQGANLSLSIPHEVANFACGRTPVCEECERLVSSGVVVVAAAGNLGFRRFTTTDGDLEGYQTISITDPGNAEGVITVGATHRNRPHSYGVSYFSSRGPTGDGRSKPDLVAPGEKITAPVPGNDEREKDGTSMAAPHVSGAAAMLMARHNELIGQPARIKQILTRTATDLGRERYFQGAGMLDILRALQSL